MKYSEIKDLINNSSIEYVRELKQYDLLDQASEFLDLGVELDSIYQTASLMNEHDFTVNDVVDLERSTGVTPESFDDALWGKYEHLNGFIEEYLRETFEDHELIRYVDLESYWESMLKYDFNEIVIQDELYIFRNI